VISDVLQTLDAGRQAGGQRGARGDVFREYSSEGAECTITYSHATPEEIDAVIREETSLADARGYTLEWKVYGHDGPPDLKDRLAAAGFEAEPAESVMVLPVTEEALRAFEAPAYDIRRIADRAGLADLVAISRDVGRRNVEEEERRLAAILDRGPEQTSVYVAYVDGEAAACGRIHFNERGEIAELCGGRTRPAHRHHGLYIALVAARLREALARHCAYVLVDALPTSEPTLRKRGFRWVTRTQPFVYRPQP